MSTFVGTRYQAPNVRSIAEQTVAELLVHPGNEFKKGVTLAAGYPCVEVGDLLGRITATGKFRRYPTALVHTGGTGTVIKLKDQTLGNVIAPPFKVGEIVNVGTDNTNTIVAVNHETGEITIGGSITFVADEDVHLTTADGAEAAVCIAARPIFSGLYDPSNPNLNNMLDVDYLVDAIFQGILKRSVLRGLDTAAVTALAAQSLMPALDAVIIR